MVKMILKPNIKPNLDTCKVSKWIFTGLGFQGILFYLPHLVWKSYEGKQVDQLLQGLNKSLFDEDEDQKKKNIIE